MRKLAKVITTMALAGAIGLSGFGTYSSAAVTDLSWITNRFDLHHDSDQSSTEQMPAATQTPAVSQSQTVQTQQTPVPTASTQTTAVPYSTPAAANDTGSTMDEADSSLPEEGEQIKKGSNLYAVIEKADLYAETSGDDTYTYNGISYVSGKVEYSGPANKKIKNISIPQYITVEGFKYEVTGISDDAFSGCRKLKKVNIGANIKSIGSNAFSGCTRLKSLKVNGEISDVGEYAFSGCRKLKNINISAVSDDVEAGDSFFSWTQKALAVNYSSANDEYGNFVKMFKLSGLSSKVKITG